MPPSKPLLLRGASFLALFAAAAAFLMPSPVSAQDELSYYARRALSRVVTGDYAEAEEICEQARRFSPEDANLVEVLIEAEMAQGKYGEAAETAAEAIKTFVGYFPIQVAGIEALRAGGQDEAAAEALKALNTLAKEANPKALSAVELVALGKAALLLGAEPKMVLSNFFQKARQSDPEKLGGHLAAGELAIEKGDYALAARILNEGRTKVGPFPDLLYLLARSYSPSDRRKAEGLIDETLEKNPNHLPALLLRAEHSIDNEDYEGAREILATTREVNPNHPIAWAFEAAIGYILDDRKKAEEARRKALAPWEKNPEVDFWIGQKISQNRRFEEGAGFLRKALGADPDYLPAKKALGQDLLRLGKEEEGWKLIKAAREKDKYDVELFNLMLLHDQLESFQSIESGQIVVRMTPEQSAIFGKRVIDLLEEASEVLGDKYGFRPSSRIVVDFYPNQADFAVRTLGMPGGIGILGASFGNVLVMNSPGGPGAMGTNWESTLWHEFCHTITLGATGNRIPRWLTEGISVYEERQRDPACGHKMTPEFRRRILEEEDEKPGLIPLPALSAALTAFNDPGTIDFAYFQSSLLVEYMLEEYGAPALKRILFDLRTNADAGQVIARRMTSLEKLEEAFTPYIRKRAEAVAPKADWTLPDPDSPMRRNPEGVASYLADHPNNIWALSAHCSFLAAERKWEEVKAPARKLIELYPEFVGAGNGYAHLARACRNLDETQPEREALREWAQRDGDAADAYTRLIELDLEENDWPGVEDAARRLLAVNPLLRSPHRALGLAAEAQKKSAAAIRAFETLLHLDPINPADINFRLGKLYAGDDGAKAKRHILLALEDAPRFREAHRLLLSIGAADEAAEDKPAPAEPAPSPAPDQPAPSPAPTP